MAFLLLGAYVSYLNYIFDIFENAEKFQTKMFCVYFHALCDHEVVSRKTDILRGLCKNNKI
jgi:hypothetical protein